VFKEVQKKKKKTEILWGGIWKRDIEWGFIYLFRYENNEEGKEGVGDCNENVEKTY